MQMCGRIATEVFNGTQAFFIGNLNMDPQLNDGMTFARERVFMVCLLVCGKLGDNGLGRFEMIAVGALIFLVGTLMVSLATHPWVSRLVWYMLGAFAVLPFSQAALEANLSNFGADQYDLAYRSQHQMQERYFWWFNVSLNLGTGLSFSLLAFYGIGEGTSHYLTSDNIKSQASTRHVPSNYYWTVFIISASLFVLSILVFVRDRALFSAKSRQTLPSSSIVGLTQYLVKSSTGCSLQGVMLLAAKVTGVTIYVSQALLFWDPHLAEPLSIASAIGVLFSVGGIITFCRRLEWFDHVERPADQPLALADVKDFLRMLPLLVCSQMAYGCLNMTMKTWFVRQACQMDLRYWSAEGMNENSPQMFTAFFEIWSCGIVVVGTPICLYLVNPRIERWCESMGWRFQDWSRYLIGLAFGLASVLCAAHFEVCRRAAPVLSVTSRCAPQGVGVRDMTAYWMIIPYVLMGISSLYVVPTIMSVSYRQVPKTMRSLTVITNVFMMSASNSMVIAMSMFMRMYVPRDLDSGNLEYLYFLCVGLSLILLGLFTSLVPTYEEKVFDDTMIRMEDDEEERPVPMPAA